MFRLTPLALLLLTVPALAETTRIDFHLNNALQGGKAKEWQRAAHFSVDFKDGAAVSGLVGPARGGLTGGWSTVAWCGRVDSVDLKRTGDKVAGNVRITVASNDVGAGEHVIALDGEIKDGKLAGKFVAKHAGQESGGSIIGDAITKDPPAADPENRLITLVLDKALPKGEPLKVYLDRQGGKFRSSFAFATAFSRRPFEIDASGLTLKGDEIAGTVKVLRGVSRTKDAEPLLGSYEVKAKLQGRLVRGTHAGSYGEEKGAGDIWGEVSIRPDAPSGATPVWVKCEDGLFGGADWQNRAFFNFTLQDGKAGEGKLFNNKGVYKGKIDRAELKTADGRVAGKIEATVSEGSISKGQYVIELDGPMVGPYFMGRFTTRHGDKEKQGYFVGGIGK